MNHVNFKYDIEKDIDNFLKGLRSVNNPNPTKLHKEFFDLYGNDPKRSLVKQFLEEKTKNESLDLGTKLEAIEKEWRSIEVDFFSRCEALFDFVLPQPVIGYVSLNSRCTYNWEEGYFFVSFYTEPSKDTIMHELLHFYTHRKFGEMLPDKQKFNEIKEALTVLLNIDFKDLMGSQIDKGYQQHQDLRQKIARLRKENKTVSEIVGILNK